MGLVIFFGVEQVEPVQGLACPLCKALGFDFSIAKILKPVLVWFIPKGWDPYIFLFEFRCLILIHRGIRFFRLHPMAVVFLFIWPVLISVIKES